MYATTGLPVLVRDAIMLIARIGLGAIFIAHGWQKFSEWTVAGTTQSFHQMGVPASEVSAPFSTYVELIGGALLILGALTPLAGLLLAINMIGAMVLVHLDAGVFVDQGGWELVAALAAGSLLLAAAGPGRLSLDQLIFRGRKTGRRKRARAASRAAADA